jgi:hypothetical protein
MTLSIFQTNFNLCNSALLPPLRTTLQDRRTDFRFAPFVAPFAPLRRSYRYYAGAGWRVLVPAGTGHNIANRRDANARNLRARPSHA